MSDLVPTTYGALTVHDALDRRNMLQEYTKSVMIPGTDYGMIPGTDKPTLLKPGAEKLCTLFGFTIRPTIVEQVMDWTGKETGGEPLFYFCYRQAVYAGERLIVEADGSANSFEKKYRFRNAQRVCPSCGQATIIKGKAEYGGGWLCFAKKGGCGGKFPAGDARIEGQETGQIANPDVFDLVNTIKKMAQKRALIAAVLLAVNASEFYTQDIEDFPDHQPQTQHYAQTDAGTVDTSTGEVVTEQTAEPTAEPTEEEKRKLQAKKEAASIKAAYLAKCKEVGWTGDPPTLGRQMLVREAGSKLDTTDLKACVQFSIEIWKQAIDELNAPAEEATAITGQPPLEMVEGGNGAHNMDAFK